MMGISEEVGGAVSSSELDIVASSQEKIREVHITSDEHLARQLQAFENILIGTSDSDFHDIFSLEPPSQFIEPNPISVPVPLEAPLSDVGLNSENVPREDNINPDSMTYEELQSLGEQIGTENKGLSDELISYLPTSKYRTGFFSRNVTEECVVCKTYYKNGQKLITLPCQHRYHADCITQWLQLNKVCPVCNEEVFGS
ncbi:E3 ubiquitin ligase BIG BROTHER-like protein [Carex littledalei]|uniref:E3 ubiquitin ligase BIG BROTHER-like protein n=1 Tax=Carex littledalei TaxID=544730 RepID=A0A833VJ82_9POAL|nr:E3 ubiquitin ligase BIG BROTHER-like protein [Carex littledalei]